jgi:hypothetical protein
MTYRTPLILLLIVFVWVVAGCGTAAAPEPTPAPTAHPGKTVVSSRCIGCHEMNRVENAAFDRKGWQLTVDRMVLAGAQLNEDQIGLAVDYLAQTYPKK